MSKRILNCLMGAMSLGVGGSFYVSFRPNTYISRWLGLACSGNKLSDSLGEWLSFYLPDFLWAFSLGSFLCALFVPRMKGLIACAVTAFLTGVMWEMLQFLGIIDGTGDFLDVLMYLLAAIIIVAINLKGILK